MNHTCIKYPKNCKKRKCPKKCCCIKSWKCEKCKYYYKCYMCYKEHMDTTIRNLDPDTYRALKARAALTGKTIGEMVNEAIESYLRNLPIEKKTGTLADFEPTDYPAESERLSEQIDALVYRNSDHQ